MITVTFNNIGERRKWSYDNVRYIELKNGRDVWVHGFDYAKNQNYRVCVDRYDFDYMVLTEDTEDESSRL